MADAAAEPLLFRIDAEFVRAVDESLRSALERISARHGESAEAQVEPAAALPQVADGLSTRLADWQVKLEAIAREVAIADDELRRQHEALLEWTEAMARTRRLVI